MLTILTIFKRVLAVFVGTALFFLMTVVFVDVILRNVFNAPLAAGTELTELLMGAMAFASFPLLTLSLGQICVELWQLDENSVMARTINFVGSLLTALFFVILAIQVDVYATRAANSGEILPQLHLSWAWIWRWMFAFSIITIITALIAAAQQFLHIRNRRKEVTVI